MQKKAQKTLQTIKIEANVLVVVLPKPKFENLKIAFNWFKLFNVF
jgi:hypothetical protein